MPLTHPRKARSRGLCRALPTRAEHEAFGLAGGSVVSGFGCGSAWAGAQALGNKALNVDLLMIVAAIGAVAIRQIFDGALLIVIFVTSGAARPPGGAGHEGLTIIVALNGMRLLTNRSWRDAASAVC
jgi:cation transport ATPase